MELYHYFPGILPVIINIPHAGTYVPDGILNRFVPAARQLPDTDWHVDQLYAFARELGFHMLVATHSRYVVDLNRSPDGQSLYPGKFVTNLCPVTLFDGAPIYQMGLEPDEREVQNRIKMYWQPYHQKLQSIIDELKIQQRVIVLDAHSICSQVPMLFSGILPSLNLGTADGISASPELTEKLISCCEKSEYSTVCNGRFKGGYITRHYGNPAQGVDAIQLELAQFNYMNEAYPYTYDEKKAKQLQKTLHRFLSVMIDWVVPLIKN